MADFYGSSVAILNASGIGTFKFFFEGKRVLPTETPTDHEMQDGDTIDAHLQQVRMILSSNVAPSWHVFFDSLEVAYVKYCIVKIIVTSKNGYHCISPSSYSAVKYYCAGFDLQCFRGEWSFRWVHPITVSYHQTLFSYLTQLSGVCLSGLIVFMRNPYQKRIFNLLLTGLPQCF